MMDFWLLVQPLLSQASDPISLTGYSGWATAGLGGLVIAWLLLKGLPEQARQTKELTEAKDKQIDQLIAAKDLAVEKLTQAFKEAQIKAIETFANVNSQAQETFASVSMKQQEAFSVRTDKTLDTFERITENERKVCQKWHEENRERHEENKVLLAKIISDYQDNRHMMANVLHEVGVAKALEGRKPSKTIYPSEGDGDVKPPSKDAR